uniref:Uncharacterized protein n=1 Tax=Neogobius melanostomus TaxID=47308 RepID=A0A8C6U385_9GOBI
MKSGLNLDQTRVQCVVASKEERQIIPERLMYLVHGPCLEPSWFVQHVVVWDLQTDNMFFFLVDGWLSVENLSHGGVEREVLASCPDELCQFRRVLSSQLQFGLVDRHLWVSVWERPAHSHFTRGQRVSCCALSLHLYLALGALWYGAVGSSQHSGPVSALVLVNMETVAVGMTLALLLFPLQCLLCFLFGKTYSPVWGLSPCPFCSMPLKCPFPSTPFIYLCYILFLQSFPTVLIIGFAPISIISLY